MAALEDGTHNSTTRVNEALAAHGRICLEGNLGALKTTVLRHIQQKFSVNAAFEPLERWGDLLQLANMDAPRWAFTFQTKVLNCFADVPSGVFCERSPKSCAEVFGAMQPWSFREKKLFDELFRKLAWAPGVHVYLRSDPEACLRRVNVRAREAERGVTLEYLKAVHEAHERVFGSDPKVVVVEVEGKTISDISREIISGIFFNN